MSEPLPAAVAAYLDALPPDRREALAAVRRVILDNLDPRFEEGIQYGMLGYYLPHSEYPAGYHCDPQQPLPFAGLASQKRHMAAYLFCLYTDPAVQERFVARWKATGRRLDMGASCVRFRRLEDVPLEVLGAAIREMTADRFVELYEAARSGAGERRATGRRSEAGRAAAEPSASAKRAVAKPTAAGSVTAKRSAAKTATAEKVTAKTASARKASAKKATAKKASAKRASAKKASAKKATAKKTTAKKATAKKATAKTSSAKKATAKKTTAKKATATEATAKKTTARKATARKATARKATAKKATAKRQAGRR